MTTQRSADIRRFPQKNPETIALMMDWHDYFSIIGDDLFGNDELGNDSYTRYYSIVWKRTVIPIEDMYFKTVSSASIWIEKNAQRLIDNKFEQEVLSVRE